MANAGALPTVLFALFSFLGNFTSAVAGFGMAIVFLFLYSLAEFGGAMDCCSLKFAVFIQSLGLAAALPILLWQSGMFDAEKRRKLLNLHLWLAFLITVALATPVGLIVQGYLSTDIIRLVVGAIIILATLVDLWRNRSMYASAFVKKKPVSEEAKCEMDKSDEIKSEKATTEGKGCNPLEEPAPPADSYGQHDSVVVVPAGAKSIQLEPAGEGARVPAPHVALLISDDRAAGGSTTSPSSYEFSRQQEGVRLARGCDSVALPEQSAVSGVGQEATCVAEGSSKRVSALSTSLNKTPRSTPEMCLVACHWESKGHDEERSEGRPLHEDGLPDVDDQPKGGSMHSHTNDPPHTNDLPQGGCTHSHTNTHPPHIDDQPQRGCMNAHIQRRVLISGVCVGTLAGFLGGLIGIPAVPLIFFFLYFEHPKVAVRMYGTSVLTVNCVFRIILYVIAGTTDTSIFGDNDMYFHGPDWYLYLSVVLCGMLGAPVGNLVFHRINQATFKLILGALVVLSGVSMIVRAAMELGGVYR